MFCPLHGFEEEKNFGLGEACGSCECIVCGASFGNDFWVIESRE
jgi:hypothetical protein